MARKVKTPIVDKNGKPTHVYKNPEEAKTTSRAVNTQPPSARSAEDEALLVEVLAEIARIDGALDPINQEIEDLVAKRKALLDEKNHYVTMQMELTAGAVTVDSPIEDIKALNRIAFWNSEATKNEDAWIRAIHPRLYPWGYDPDHQVPCIAIPVDDKVVDDELADGIRRFVDATADGRDVLYINLLDGSTSGRQLAVFAGKDEAFEGTNGRPRYSENETKSVKDMLDKLLKDALAE